VSGRRWLIAAAALAGVAVTFSLGVWQWGRGHEKEALAAAVASRAALPPLDAQALAQAADPQSLVHRQVVLAGTWAPAHTVYLENRQMNGRPGFYVATPLLLAPGQAVLVQRGWAPRDFQDRTRLPAVETPAGAVVVRGRLAPPPAKLYEFQSAPAGRIRQNLDLAAFRAETQLPLLVAVSVQQSGPASEGLLREWPEAASTAGKNYGYAFQWWALAALIAVLYVWFQFVVPRRRARP
jgi:surfeit locus 1 family protein